ncbi:hypothetical protein INT47_004698 [Mucor saturninus]|uniref:Flavin-containing monooxygenase n=1 Tax=Mucor saturninus TaxID=64648 RepID=A0A8H7QLL3_9FUNG|nr:hypothetical protein INT47_004698 [Mucor saturninus]
MKHEKKTLEETVQLSLAEAEEALKHPFVFKKPIKNVAVIGAGPSGLPSARHLRDAGMNVRVFERKSDVGGIWNYSDTAPLKPKIPTSRVSRAIDPEAFTAPLEGRDKKTVEMTPETQKLLLRKCPPTACYRDLYNNTSVHLFNYPDFPYPKDTPHWAPHTITKEYFQRYAKEFDLLPLIEFNTCVELVAKNKENDTWEVSLCKFDVYPSGLVRVSRWKETFDAVVGASGLHQEPFVPDIKDLTAWNKMWPDKASHSQQYRRPEDFKDKDVLVVGGAISAVDVVRGLEGFAKSITMSIDGPVETPFYILNLIRSKIPESVVIKPNIAAFSDADGNVDGTILFTDDSTLQVDHVIFCTGFINRLKYLGDLVIRKEEEELEKEKDVFPGPSYANVPESHVVVSSKFPLNVYREVFVMSDPTLAFVGFPPYFSTPSHFDTHARTVARVWSGNAKLPNAQLMDKFTSEFVSGISPLEIFHADRQRREPFIQWINHHAAALNPDLPKLENYPADYEERGDYTMTIWSAISDENVAATKKRVQESLA